MLGGRCSSQTLNLAGWSTSPRAYGAQWSVQSLGSQTGRLVDHSPSLRRSVVGTVPRFSNWKAGQPVPERIVLVGRYSPQVCHTQSSISSTCLLEKASRHINAWCDKTSWRIVRRLCKKVHLVTAQPLFAWFKKRKPPIMQKRTILTAGNFLKTVTPHPPQGPPTSLECGKWKR